jgi:glycosyltransferase involved in cell wall biosynthesis
MGNRAPKSSSLFKTLRSKVSKDNSDKFLTLASEMTAELRYELPRPTNYNNDVNAPDLGSTCCSSADNTILIVCPVLNEASGISNTIQSLRDQVCQHFDVIFFDSGSSDDTVSIISHSGLPNSKLITCEDNLGVSKNWARALKASLAEGSHSRFMFLGGDDELGPDFVSNLQRLRLTYSDTRVQFIPEFLGVREGVWETQPLVSPSLFSVKGLLSAWKVVHACYGVFDRDFMADSYLPTLEKGTTNFDWWVTYQCLGQSFRVSKELKYGKYLKGRDYASSYYTGRNQPQFLGRKLIWTKLLDPYREFKGLIHGGAHVLGDLPSVKRVKLLFQILFWRYLSAAKRFFSRNR